MKFWMFTLLLANLVMAGYLYASETRVVVTENTDLNASKLRIVPFEPPKPVEKVATAPATTADGQKMICVQWSGIAGDELQQAKDFLTPLVPLSSISEKHVEQPTRFWVNIPPSANPMTTLIKLKTIGIKDVSLMQPSNAISLGLFKTEETAKRYLEEIQSKGFKEARVEPRRMEIKEASLTVKDANKELIDKLNEYKNQFEGTSVETVDCPVTEKKSEKAPS